MLDIDCHASGTLEGATQFAEYLKRELLPEPLLRGLHPRQRRSTGSSSWTRGSGGTAEYKGVLVEVEKWLKRVLRSTDFDVEDVELKGTPMTVEWGAGGGR